MLKIGELAARAGINHQTLHYYERLGLMQPTHRAKSGHRYYTEDALERLHCIQQLKDIGLSLEEIAPVIDAYFTTPASRSGRKQALEGMRDHLRMVRSKLDGLRTFEQQLVSNITRLEVYLSPLPANEGTDSDTTD